MCIRDRQESLAALAANRTPENLLSFEELRKTVGFEDYYTEFDRYGSDNA